MLSTARHVSARQPLAVRTFAAQPGFFAGLKSKVMSVLGQGTPEASAAPAAEAPAPAAAAAPTAPAAAAPAPAAAAAPAPAAAAPAAPAAASAYSPWGSDTWRYDKNSFLSWCEEATTNKESVARRELYGMLAMRFGDSDVDKDGKISAAEFDFLCEDVASLPRRFGLAPSWEKEYGTIARRIAARKAMFDMLDLRQGEPRHWIGLEQFVNWATDHLITKVATIDEKDVDFYHIEQYTEEQCLAYLEDAVTDPNSKAYASLYEFLLAIFTEVDANSTGVLHFKEFDALLSRAAVVPRTFGLAPPDASSEIRKQFFDGMLDEQMGGVTFRKLLAWTVEHSKGKIEMQKAGKGYKK